MTATIKSPAHQSEQIRLEDTSYSFCETTTTDVENYTFTISTYQPVGTSLSALESLLPLVSKRINRSLAKPSSFMLPSDRKSHTVTVQEGGKK
ncbi:MAG: hypothetical protein FWD27_04545 [Coriobacteriia bacterium]|nr:hypothetical protein [Coriobacteriia bacterium]